MAPKRAAPDGGVHSGVGNGSARRRCRGRTRGLRGVPTQLSRRGTKPKPTARLAGHRAALTSVGRGGQSRCEHSTPLRNVPGNCGGSGQRAHVSAACRQAPRARRRVATFTRASLSRIRPALSFQRTPAIPNLVQRCSAGFFVEFRPFSFLEKFSSLSNRDAPRHRG